MAHPMSHDGDGLRCMHCGSQDLSVKDSRAHAHSVRRRRKCNSCGKGFYTREVWSDWHGKPIDGQDKAMWLGLPA